MGQEDADRHLAVATKQLDRVQTASWDPTDEDREDAVTWGFYAYENGVVAVVEKANMAWRKNHGHKLDLADEIHTRGYVSTNVRARLEELKRTAQRRAVWRSGCRAPGVRSEALSSDLEKFLDEVQAFVES